MKRRSVPTATSEKWNNGNHTLLRILEANRTRFGLSAEALTLLAERFGITITQASVHDRMSQLAKAKLARKHQGNVPAWSITLAGIMRVDEWDQLLKSGTLAIQ
ncbi:hypothetical protein GC207_14730 [bacterium]|nr:hypothetical protein [bacterium]